MKFTKTYCSQCGAEFGAGDEGFSSCKDHALTTEPQQERRRKALAEPDQWKPYLKDGETPFERFTRERKDLDALLELYKKAIAALNNWDNDNQTAQTHNKLLDSMEALRTALAQPEDVMVRFSRINQEMDGLLHDKAHTDTGKTRAAQSVRTPEMSYRPGSLPMEDKPVAWGMLSKGVIVDAICPKEHDREEGDYTVALYRNPPARELTEAEITALSIKPENYPRHAFARAIIAASSGR